MFSLNPPPGPVAVDLAHAALLLGTVASLKPAEVLELGVGPGYTTGAILQALAWNQKGRLTLVDNWYDWEGQEPPHVQALRDAGVNVVVSDEENFVKTCKANTYDLLVSDADHDRSNLWIDDHLRIVRSDGLMFFHDTAGESFPNLASVLTRVKERNLPHYHFKESSRADEGCQRGWLMVQNQKARLALVTSWDSGTAKLAALTQPNKEAYCQRHGYSFRGGLQEEGKPWSLPLYLMNLLPEFDWVVWMDVDLLVMNQSVPLDNYLDLKVDLVGGYDAISWNHGLFFLRNSPWSMDFLKKWAAPRQCSVCPPSSAQSSLVQLLCQEPKDKWKCMGEEAFDSWLRFYQDKQGVVTLEENFKRPFRAATWDTNTLEEEKSAAYDRARSTDSHINEHLPLLYALAKECEHVTEFGRGPGNSTIAFIRAAPKKILSYDLLPSQEDCLLKGLAGDNDVRLLLGDTRKIDIEPTDLLFIDTDPNYEHLKAELDRHGEKVRKYIVLHGTITWGSTGSDGSEGILTAIEEWLDGKPFEIDRMLHNNNGLMVLKRTDEPGYRNLHINPKRHLAIATAWDAGIADLAELTQPNKEAYCRKHGYELRGGLMDRAGHWVKLAVLKEALPEFDWVVWMDVDLLVMNQAIGLEEFLDDNVDLIGSYDAIGWNNGVFFLRNTPWSMDLLKKWAAVRRRYEGHPSPEQSALVHILYKEPKEKWKCVGQKAFNSYLYDLYPALNCPEGQYTPGDFILHLPGISNERRMKIISRYLPEVMHLEEACYPEMKD